MKSPEAHQNSPGEYKRGETLPLFEGLASSSSGPEPAHDMPTRRRGAGPFARSSNPADASSDQHMRAAWRLARALKAAKTGHKAGREFAKLSPGQRHQVGTAICEHLLASLKQQLQSERPVSKH